VHLIRVFCFRICVKRYLTGIILLYNISLLFNVLYSEVRKQLAASGQINQSELTEKIKKVLDILTGAVPNTQSSLKNTSVASSTPSTPQTSMTSDDKYNNNTLSPSVFIRVSLIGQHCWLICVS